MVHFKRWRVIACLVVLSGCGTFDRQVKAAPETKPAPVAQPAPKPAEPSLEPLPPKDPPKPVPPNDPPKPVAEAAPATSPERSAVPEKPPAVPAPANKGDTTNGHLGFPAGSSALDEAGSAALRTHAIRLKKTPGLVVTLVAYSDAVGSRNYNLAVAEERLASVTAILRSLGVARNQIRRVNAGYKPPPASCGTAACALELLYGP